MPVISGRRAGETEIQDISCFFNIKRRSLPLLRLFVVKSHGAGQPFNDGPVWPVADAEEAADG